MANNKPDIRFNGHEEEWEEKKVSSQMLTRRGLTYRPSSIRERGVKVLRSSNIDDDTFIESKDDVYVEKSAINIDYAKENDILITAANGSSRLVGKHCILKNIEERPMVHGGFMLLGTAENPFFFNASMGSEWYKNFIKFYVAGGSGAIGNLNKSDLDEQLVLVPNKLEQQKIGDLFRNLDELIEAKEQELEKLRQIKLALLNGMFPSDEHEETNWGGV